MSEIGNIFKTLYPDEAVLNANKIVKNGSGYDISPAYKLGDIFKQDECITINEQGPNRFVLCHYISNIM